jgi:hypothetical protein
LDPTLFWTTADLESKLLDFKTYFNHQRTHSARAGRPPDDVPTCQHRDKRAPKSPVSGEPSLESLIGGDAVKTL